MQGQLNKKYTDSAKALFNAASGSVADKRKMHQDIGDKVNSLVTEIRMYEKGISAVGELCWGLQISVKLRGGVQGTIKARKTHLTTDSY
jgi:hypothetical protein